MSDTFKLPASSLEEIVKIIQAYANEKEGALLSLDDISQTTGIPRTAVSANNGFLVQLGLITEGNKKTTTETGRALGRAYISKVDYEIDRLWKEIITENDFLNRMISAVRIRNGMDRTSFLNHIIYSSGQKDTKQNRAGASAVIEIMKSVMLLNETDGKLTVCAENTDTNNAVENTTVKNIEAPTNENTKITISTPTSKNAITININIDCTVNELDSLAEKLQNLLNGISE